MRSNSGRGESSNNLHDPTLRDKERAKGVSGEAVLEKKKAGSEPSPTSQPQGLIDIQGA